MRVSFIDAIQKIISQKISVLEYQIKILMWYLPNFI
jgi:hypothetical protein